MQCACATMTSFKSPRILDQIIISAGLEWRFRESGQLACVTNKKFEGMGLHIRIPGSFMSYIYIYKDPNFIKLIICEIAWMLIVLESEEGALTPMYWTSDTRHRPRLLNLYHFAR